MSLVATVAWAPAPAFAQSDGDPPDPAEPQLHGFVSQGGFVSTTNDYIGDSSRGSLALFEAGLNVQLEPADRLRVGIQLFARNVGEFDAEPRIDWAFADYTWRPWLGLRAGRVKMPFGLHNEWADVDAARLSVLLPQGLYPVRNRDALLSHTGLALHGTVPLACGRFGELEYQTWLGTLSIPRNALELQGAELADVDTRYVTGGQVFWRPPVDGLRVGASYLRASIDFHLLLDPDITAALIAAMLVPPDYDGSLLVAQRPVQGGVASAEYTRGDWVFTGEYSRSWTRQVSDLPALVPETNTNPETFYAMVTYRATERLEVGTYYSVEHVDADDREGRDGVATMRWPERFHGFQRDLSATLRYDVNDHWLWKLEAHFMDGTASLSTAARAGSERYWGLFLFKTTVTF